MDTGGIDVTRVQGLIERLQKDGTKPAAGEPSSQAFEEMLRSVSESQKDAADAAAKLITTGEGELHDVQIKMAKADLAFRFLVEVRNKLTDAYQEISRLPV